MKNILFKLKPILILLLSFIMLFLSSCGVFTTKELHGEELKKRYDFDSFDNKYVELPTLQSYITEYIKANIEKF